MKPSKGPSVPIVGPSSTVSTKSGSKPSNNASQIVSPIKGASGKASPRPAQGNQIISPTKGA